MSHYDYTMSRTLALEDPPFASLIMAAMRKAGGKNADKLRDAFPEIWLELVKRYNAAGGYLAGEVPE